MAKIKELINENSNESIWQSCCGFLDLYIGQFMAIQKQLLLEQLPLLQRSELGRKVMRGAMPQTIDEFRNTVPITTYSDYCPELLEKREDVLPAKPALWIQTSGRSGEYPYKWVPVTEHFWKEAGQNFSAIAVLGSCKHKYDIQLKNNFRLLHAAAQSPCLTGAVAHKLAQDLGFRFFPDLQESENLSFDQRVAKGVKIGLSDGMDGFFGLAGILVAIGEKIKRGSGNTKLSGLLSNPKMLTRVLKGKLKAKLAKRGLLPKDLWTLKVIASMGTDSLIYKNKIQELWGRAPLDVYGNTESTVIATQTWDYKDMVFFPNLNFLEFMPEEEHDKLQADRSYKPKTVLLDEVKAGENYELIITNLHGGALVRYRIGDMIKITSLQNDTLGINLPQMAFERRADDLIDLGFVRLTERIIWQALENSGLPYVGWTARKEIDSNRSRLHLYVELQEGYCFSEKEIASVLYQHIKNLEDGLYVYKDLKNLEQLIDFRPIEVTLLPNGVFNNYKVRRQAEGSSIAHLKPPHINPADHVLVQLGIGARPLNKDKEAILDEEEIAMRS